MEKRIIVICEKNLVRSVIAKQMLERKLADAGVDGAFSVDTAGIRQSSQESFLNLENYLNSALRSSGYAPVEHHRPKMVNRGMVSDSDIAFTINSKVQGLLADKWKGIDSLTGKLKLLPQYGAPSPEVAQDNIFDPDWRSVSPRDELSRSNSIVKNASTLLLRALPGNFSNALIHNLTGYVPLTRDGSYRDERIALYAQTINDLEPFIDGAVKRMKRENYL